MPGTPQSCRCRQPEATSHPQACSPQTAKVGQLPPPSMGSSRGPPLPIPASPLLPGSITMETQGSPHILEDALCPQPHKAPTHTFSPQQPPSQESNPTYLTLPQPHSPIPSYKAPHTPPNHKPQRRKKQAKAIFFLLP